jgi:hypothetical protein
MVLAASNERKFMSTISGRVRTKSGNRRRPQRRTGSNGTRANLRLVAIPQEIGQRQRSVLWAKHQELRLSVAFPTHSARIQAAWLRCNTVSSQNLSNLGRRPGRLVRQPPRHAQGSLLGKRRGIKRRTRRGAGTNPRQSRAPDWGFVFGPRHHFCNCLK